jgi:hypothetical protein
VTPEKDLIDFLQLPGRLVTCPPSYAPNWEVGKMGEMTIFARFHRKDFPQLPSPPTNTVSIEDFRIDFPGKPMASLQLMDCNPAFVSTGSGVWALVGASSGIGRSAGFTLQSRRAAFEV